jgi:hypothetical protein
VESSVVFLPFSYYVVFIFSSTSYGRTAHGPMERTAC